MHHFFITLLIDPHLSWEQSPLPFMLSEASLICFLLCLGWVNGGLGSFLSLGVFSLSFVISSGVLSLLLIGVPVDTGVSIDDGSVGHQRVYPLPPSWWVLVSSLLL